MKKEILFGFLLITFLIYVLFIGIPLIRLEAEEKVIKLYDNQEESKNLANFSSKILLPAVDEDEQGIMAWLEVELTEGTGRTLLGINHVTILQNTQESIRTGKKVAEELAEIKTSDYDIIYSMDANASQIEGPSAGPAIAIVTLFALENRKINTSVVISGYLREDGSIERVSGLLAKARAAKEMGVKLFLVPKDQSMEYKVEKEKICEHGVFETFCETKEIRTKISIEEEVGIDVVEVENISEAFEYFIID
jgi:predicted S18 family serine protease